MLYSYPLRAEHALQRTQRHILCAGVPPNRRKLPFSRGPCARSMAYSALRGIFSAQGYRLQLPPARGTCPTVPSVAQSLRRGTTNSSKTAISRGPCARSITYSALSGTFSAQGYARSEVNGNLLYALLLSHSRPRSFQLMWECRPLLL